MKVYEAMANAFVKEGATTIFGLLGDGQLNWWPAISKYPNVRIIDARDEGAALSMAEGWAMATKKVGVCSVTHGPGITRMGTSLVVATRSHTPVVVYTSRTEFNNPGSLQFIDQERFVSSTGAGYLEVLNPSFAENAVRQAFYRARLERRPYVLAVPMQIQGRDIDAEGDEYQPSSTLFAGQQRIRPDAERLAEAVRIIAASQKPVIVLGRGAMEPQAQQAVARLAERIGALIATSLLANGTLRESDYHAGISGLFASRTTLKLFETADCVIALGASLNTQTIEGGYLYQHARMIHVDITPHVLMGNDQGADCYLQGDAATTVAEIDELLAKQGVAKQGFRTLEVRKALVDKDRDPQEFEIESGTVDPREASRIIDEKLPANVDMVMGAGHFFAIPAALMRRPRKLQIYANAFGCIGQGLATAIGAAVGTGGPLVCIEGDGGALQNIQELDTLGRIGVKMLYLLLNDEAYGAEYHKLKAKGADPNLSALRTPDFGALGRDFGCRGRIARSLDELSAGLDEFMAGDGPMVIDLRVSRSVLNISYRRLHYGMDV